MKSNKSAKNARVYLERQLDEIAELAETVLFAFFVVILLFTYVLQISTVDGSSMENTLQSGERVVSVNIYSRLKTGDPIVIVAKNAYLFDRSLAFEYSYAHIVKQITDGKLKRMTDAQIRRTAEEYITRINADGTNMYRAIGLEKRIVKRVVAVEGQSVDIDFKNGDVFVDGELIDEPYIKNLTLRDASAFKYPLTIPKGYVFVLGDNREISKDSRHPDVGLVPTSSIAGKVLLKIYPISNFGVVK